MHMPHLARKEDARSPEKYSGFDILFCQLVLPSFQRIYFLLLPAV